MKPVAVRHRTGRRYEEHEHEGEGDPGGSGRRPRLESTPSHGRRNR